MVIIRRKDRELSCTCFNDSRYLEKHYGERLVSVVLFGLVARQKQRPNSDIDLLIVVENLPKSRIKQIQEFESVEREVEHLIESLDSSPKFCNHTWSR